LVVFAVFLSTCQAVSASADERVLSFNTPLSATETGRFTDILLDPDHRLTIEDAIGERSTDFQPIATRAPDVGYSRSMIWLRLKLENSHEVTSEWRLYFKENFKQIFHLYIVDSDGKISHPLAQDLSSGFSSRPIAFPEIVVPLSLSPGENATVYVQYWTEGSTYLPLFIETVESFNKVATQNAAKQFVFYGMMAFLILSALFGGLVIRHSVFPAYIGYAGSCLLYIMHSDGVAFQYLWPNLPALNSYASVIAGGSYGVFGAICARIMLRTPKLHTIIDKLLLGVIVVIVSMMVFGFLVDPSFVKKTLILIVAFAVGLFTVAAIIAARKRFKQVRFYLVAWLGATMSAVLMTMRHWLGIDISQEFQYDSMRVVVIFDAMMMGFAIIDRFNQMRQERQSAMQESLKQAQRNLSINTRLRNLEARYELALERTARQDEQVQSTVHDMRQPLHALRLAVQCVLNETEKHSEHSYGDIYESFDYVEALVSQHLLTGAGLPSTDESQEMQLNDILNSIYEMFSEDAKEKGLDIHFVPTSLQADIQPLAVMRIVSNLVSNSIKYTQEGKILLGVRRRKNKFEIQIHDTGIGMSEAEFQKAARRGERLDKALSLADGHGHGLAIVTELAEANNFEFKLLSRKTLGTSVTLSGFLGTVEP
jgi:signal transduction histidine kinase